eukprot:COSAG06_NODE_27082_length_601_cov_30.316733_2_plen_84_part_01
MSPRDGRGVGDIAAMPHALSVPLVTLPGCHPASSKNKARASIHNTLARHRSILTSRREKCQCLPPPPVKWSSADYDRGHSDTRR